jgi:hypothetical protein
MQITINQAEIEQAIKSHILGVIAINPNQQIDIDLKATRGDTGYQAIINITEASGANQIELASSNVTRMVGGVLGKAPKVQVSNPVPARVPSTPAEVRQMMAEEAAAEEETQEAEQQEEQAEEEAHEAVEEAAEVVEEAAEPEPAPVAPKRLGRPPNALRVAAVQTAPEPVAEQVAGAPDQAAPAPKRLFGGFTKPKN